MFHYLHHLTKQMNIQNNFTKMSNTEKPAIKITSPERPPVRADQYETPANDIFAYFHHSTKYHLI